MSARCSAMFVTRLRTRTARPPRQSRKSKAEGDAISTCLPPLSTVCVATGAARLINFFFIFKYQQRTVTLIVQLVVVNWTSITEITPRPHLVGGSPHRATQRQSLFAG